VFDLSGLGGLFLNQACSHFSEIFKRLQCLLSLHFKTSMSSVFTFSRLQCLQSLHFKTSMSSIFYISRLQCLQFLHFKTSMSSVFTFTRLQCLQSLHFKTSMSLVFTFTRLQHLQCLHFKTSMSSIFTFEDFNVSYFVVQDYNVFCLTLLILHANILLFFFTGFTSLVFASCWSDSKIARMKLVSLSLLTFSFSIKDN